MADEINGPMTPNDLKKIDKEIEADIKHLKRSSNLLAALGLTIIVLFILLLSLKITQNFGVSEKSLPRFIESATVIVDDTPVRAQPSTSAAAIATLSHNTRLLITKDDPDGWFKVHIVDPVRGGKNPIEGWLMQEDVRTHAEERQMRREMAKKAVKTIDILDVNWTIDEVGNYTISGKVLNLTDLPLSDIKIIITFYDENNNVVDQRKTIVATDSPLRKNLPVPFVFIGKNEKNFNFVNCRADYRFAED